MQDSYVSYPIFSKLSLMYSSSLWNSKLSLRIISCCYTCILYRWYLRGNIGVKVRGIRVCNTCVLRLYYKLYLILNYQHYLICLIEILSCFYRYGSMTIRLSTIKIFKKFNKKIMPICIDLCWFYMAFKNVYTLFFFYFN